jgi:hypothetical protein
MDKQSSERSGEEGRENPNRQFEEKTALGDVALFVLAPQVGELHLDDAEILKIGGRWAYRGRTNGTIVVRYTDTTLGHVEKNPIGVYRSLPRQ